MILQDLAGILLSSLSFFAHDVFRLAVRNYKQLRQPTEEESQSNCRGITNSLNSIIHARLPNNPGYGTIPSQDTPPRCNLFKSFLHSIWTSVAIFIAALPLRFLASLLLFADLNTVNICSGWIEHKDLRVDGAVLRWKLIGDVFVDLGLFYWFPSTMIFLFGWKEFKANYLVILVLCFSALSVNIIYKLFLFIFNAYVAMEFYYHLAGNVCFFTSILCSSCLIAVKIRKNGNFAIPPPKILIMATVCAQFVFAFIIGLTGAYTL